MLINFSYSELLQISSALNIVETVYGGDSAVDLLFKVNDAMEAMDNMPITDVYPGVPDIVRNK